MAEAAGLAVGVVALSGLFNNTVQCFEFVQLGRAFGKNYQTSQLKLDNARLRLSRWGKSLGLGDDLRETVSLVRPLGSDAAIKHAESLLGQILELFAEAEGVSNKYKSRTKPEDGSLVLYNSQTDLDPAMAEFHHKMRQLAIERQNRSGLRQKAKWALYQEKQFGRLIEDITELVDGLVELFPASQQAQRELCDVEVATVGGSKGISMLREIAAAQDKLLEEAFAKATDGAEKSHHIVFSGGHNAGVQLSEYDLEHDEFCTSDLLRDAQNTFTGAGAPAAYQRLPATMPRPFRSVSQPHAREPLAVSARLATTHIPRRHHDNAMIQTTFAGPGNQGVEVGHNSGHIESHFHAPAERPETPPQPSCFVPFRRDADFVDQGTLLDQIRERCSAPASRVALVGLGGVGKSQLAIEHCYRTAEQSRETWVFWVHASNTSRLEQSYREIAEQVKVRGRKDPQADVFKLVHDWLRNEKNGPWLLVLDNADDAAVLSSLPSNSQKSHADEDANGSNSNSGALQQHLSRYLPPSRHGSVLVTSRTKRAAMQIVEDSDIVSVEPMDDAAAHALLRKKLGAEGESESDIIELAAALNHMPLALVQAAAYIRERASRCSVRQYLEEYSQSDSRKTSLLNQEAGRLRRDEAASNSVLITWQISFDHIQSKRKSAADLLSLMSFFDRQGIQETLLRSQSGTANEHMSAASAYDGFEDDVLTLRDFSFIKITKNVNTFEMHSLVQLAMRVWLENQNELDKWREQFISNLCAELPTGRYENWEKCQALFPHARAALAQRPKDKDSLEKWALLLYNAAWYAWARGRANEAEHMATTSMKVRRAVYGEQSLDTLDSMDMVGVAMDLGGRWEEAEAIHRQTLATRENVLGAEHVHTLVSMNNLAAVLGVQGKCKEAEAMHRHTLATCEKVLGSEHPDTLSSLNNLAITLHQQDKYEEAEVTYRQTLVRAEKVLGGKHPYTLMSASSLAYLLAERYRYTESLALYERTCAAFQSVLGMDHPDTRACRQHYAEARRQASTKQGPSELPAQTLGRGVKIHTSKVSRLARGLAKIGRRGAKDSTRQKTTE